MEMYNNDLIMCLFKKRMFTVFVFFFHFFASVVSLYPLFRVLNLFVILYNIILFSEGGFMLSAVERAMFLSFHRLKIS